MAKYQNCPLMMNTLIPRAEGGLEVIHTKCNDKCNWFRSASFINEDGKREFPSDEGSCEFIDALNSISDALNEKG